jgi:hypothetical protein
MIAVETVLKHIGEEDCFEALRVEWQESQAALPQDGIDFLQAKTVREALEYSGYTAEGAAPAVALAARIQTDPLLAALIWHYAWRTFESLDEHWFSGFPRMGKYFGEEAETFFLLVGSAMVPRVRALHQAWGIPPEVTQDTCRQLWSYSIHAGGGTPGKTGIPLGLLFWLRHYTREPYFRLGRYEFWLKRMEWEYFICRSRLSGQVVALAPGGARFDAQGYMPADWEPEQAGDWRSTLEVNEKTARGYPISPLGHALPQAITLDLDEWQPVLGKGDWVLDMHIPTGGGMSPEAVHASWRRAAEFFPHHFPERPPKATICWSWIYNPGLAEILPPESNLVRNLGDAYLLPVESGPHEGLNFMFYQDHFDPQTAPRRTSLQRAILDYLAAGKRWRCGGMFYLLEDFDRLGQEVYRRR